MINPLKSMSTADLEQELLRRKEEEENAMTRERHVRRKLQVLVLTPDVINAFAPEHERTSCSDENKINTWMSHSSGNARCLRCALLSGYIPEGFHYKLSIGRD